MNYYFENGKPNIEASPSSFSNTSFPFTWMELLGYFPSPKFVRKIDNALWYKGHKYYYKITFIESNKVEICVSDDNGKRVSTIFLED